MTSSAARTRPHVRPVPVAVKPRPNHRRDVQEEYLRELAPAPSLRVRSRPVVLRRTGVGRLAS